MLATAWGKSFSPLMSPGASWQPRWSAPPKQLVSPGWHRRRQTAPRFWLVAPGKMDSAVRISARGRGIWLGLATWKRRSKPSCMFEASGALPNALLQTKSAVKPRPALSLSSFGQ